MFAGESGKRSKSLNRVALVDECGRSVIQGSTVSKLLLRNGNCRGLGLSASTKLPTVDARPTSTSAAEPAAYRASSIVIWKAVVRPNQTLAGALPTTFLLASVAWIQ